MPPYLPILISIATLVVGTLVPLSIAALHRKQMRQIELHRSDPTVPLVPPAHPITRFLKIHGVPLICIGLNLGFLIHDVRQTGPITRSQVSSIAFGTAAVLGLVLMEVWGFMLREIIKLMDRQMDMQADALLRLNHIVDRLINTLRPGN
jgi:hypothetical protein